MSEEKIINPIPPTETDLKILAYMDTGNYVDDVIGSKMFDCYGIRDVVYRLRKAGYIVLDRWVYYRTTKENKPKKYKQWFTKEPEIKPAGQKVETPYVKGIKNTADYASEILASSKKSEVLQPTLF